MLVVRNAIRRSVVAALALAFSVPVFAQGMSFNGVNASGGGGEVSIAWDNDIGPDPKVNLGMIPGLMYSGQTLSTTVFGDPWQSEIGPISADLSIEVPPVTPLPSGGIVVTLSTHNRNFSGYTIGSGGIADFYVYTPGPGLRYYAISWKAEYTNGGGSGQMSAGITVGGVGNYSENFGGVTGPFVKEGTWSGVLPAGTTNHNFSVSTGLYQGQDPIKADGTFVFTMTIVVSGCGNTASDVSYGAGKAGTTGVPILAAGAPLKLGTTGTLLLSNARPNTLAYMLIGFSQTNLPLFGGTLLAAPDILIPFHTAPDGTFTLPEGPLPANGAFCGITIYHQAVIIDAGATGAPYSLTNGVARTIGS